MEQEKGKGKRKRKEEDDAARSETGEGKSFTDITEGWIKDLGKAMKIGSAKYKGKEKSSASTEAESVSMTQEKIDLVYELYRQKVPLHSIVQMMGVKEGAVSYPELKKVILDAEISFARYRTTHVEKPESSTFLPSGEAEFEPYDPVRWEKADEENIVGRAPTDEEMRRPGPSKPIDNAIPKGLQAPPGSPNLKAFGSLKLVDEEDFEQEIQDSSTPQQVFVRALKDSKTESKPYYRKGDILRVINQAQGENLDDQHFELLPLRPPGQAGQALIQDFELADREAADKVGEEARTPKEILIFHHAMEWEDLPMSR